MAGFEQSGAVFSPVPFAVAVRIIPSPGAPCAQLVNFINRERRGGGRHQLLGYLILLLLGRDAKEANLDRGTLERVLFLKQTCISSVTLAFAAP